MAPIQPYSSKSLQKLRVVTTMNQSLMGGSDTREGNLCKSKLVLTSKSAPPPASRTTSLINARSTKIAPKIDKRRASTAGIRPTIETPVPVPSTTIVFDSSGRTFQYEQMRNFDQKQITPLTSTNESVSCRESRNQLPKIKAPCIPASDNRRSYKSSSAPNLKRETEKKSSFPVVVNPKIVKALKSETSLHQRAHQSDSFFEVGKKCGVKSFTASHERCGGCGEGGESEKHESGKMKTARSELSLLEQKRLQWAQEREELNGLWSPWGAKCEAIDTTKASPPLQMQASYPSPTNVVSSAYMATLSHGPGAYSQSQSYSECYLPPINSTIAQQPRQKAKVWNAEFQPEDYRYENDSTPSSLNQNNNNHRYSLNNVHHANNAPSTGTPNSRKASLPNYMYDSGGAGDSRNQHYEGGGDSNIINHQWSSSPIDDEPFTSGYYSSENNNNGTDDGHHHQQSSRKHHHPEVLLKPTSRERTYQEEVTVQKQIAIRGEHNASPRVIMHKIYAQNGEMILQHDGNQEVIVNSMAVATGVDGGNKGSQHDNSSSRSPCGHLPRNHAMRSSLTIGVDSSTIDAYNDIDRRQKQQWLNELDKQRDEQRLRKMMEKEERRPRWGERGIGVGHFWEPNESENSHLPAPPHTTRGKYTLSPRGEGYTEDGGGGSGDVYSPGPYQHPGQSNTPPAWLERSLTRMQSSKSQPSLHDPDFLHDMDGLNNAVSNESVNNGMNNKTNNHLLTSSRSLNHSASDLMGEAVVDSRTHTRGHNLPVDPETMAEREKKRQANQEHLEALKQQIEDKKQKEREEKELRLQEEREQEIRMAKQREMELQRLEREKRGKIPVNADMPNCVEENDHEIPDKTDSSNVNSTKISSRLDTKPLHDTEEEKDIEIVQRQSVLVTTEPIIQGYDQTTGESSDTINNHHHSHRSRLSRQDQSVMTDVSDPSFERTLTPSFQRSRSLSISRSIREFGTQTELSDGSSSSSASGDSSCGSVKNCDKNRSHNSLLDKKAKEQKQQQQQQEKKTEERPRWGSNPVKKLYVKQSEKDPNYVNRMKRRQERLRRMEEDRSVRVDTGTESEDVSIPFHRIRQRRSDASPQRRVSRGIAPLKATATVLPQKTESLEGSGRINTDSESSAELRRHHQQRQLKVDKKTDNNNGHKKSNPSKPIAQNTRSMGVGDMDVNTDSSSMKNSKSETQLIKGKTADILDRNFGSVAGLNAMGTSEESSGFSTPFLPRRDIGSGSTGSGTTGSGSGVQSPDLTYHTYAANKSSREERKYAKNTSGRDTHSSSENKHNAMNKNITQSSTTISSATSGATDFTSLSKGFIPQRDFDEIPIKPAKDTSFLQDEPVVAFPTPPKGSPRKTTESKMSSPTKSRQPTIQNNKNPNRQQQQRNKSLSPQRKTRSPVKVRNNKNPDKEYGKPSRHFPKSTNNLHQNNNEEINLPNIPQDHDNHPVRPTSPPVPALLKKMQMGLQPDESGRISSLPTEFPDILTPLPTIPIGLLSPNPSRLSSAVSLTSTGKFDIDIAVTPRSNPDIVRLFEAAEERIKQRQLSAIMSGNNGKLDSDSGKSRTSFEADIGKISINLDPVMLFANGHGNGRVDSARLSIRSNSISPRPSPSPATGQTATASHEAFIASILNSKEVKEQLSARESELSEKGIIEFSIRLPSTSSGDDFIDEYKDPLLTERRRHTAQWLYGGQNVPPKQAILTNLATLKKGIAIQQQQDWKVGPSDTE